jgi:hypothetical protein
VSSGGYGFGKKAGPKAPAEAPEDEGRLDLSGITRTPLPLDPVREQAAIERGAKLGFVDRGAGEAEESGTVVRRRRQPAPQSTVYIKGPKEILDWFIEFSNERGHRAYWQALAEFRDMIDNK